MAPGLSEYELQRQKNVEENRRILQGIRQEQQSIIESMQPKPEVKPAKPKRTPQPKSADENGEPSNDSDMANSRRRKSARLSGKKFKSWKNEDLDQSDEDEDFVDSNDSEYSDEDSPRKKKKKKGIRRTKGTPAALRPKVVIPKDRPNFYGAVPGIPVGKIWETRMACCADGVQRPTVAGIHAGPEGAYSISLAGGYEDDVDLGDSFTYTGEGGRALKGKDGTRNLRTAPQSFDQTLTRGNLALSLSVETRKPVRVIRGYKLRNEFAPESGYRYDGLYTVDKYWSCTGHAGYKVYKFALTRCPGQAPAPWSPDFVPPVNVPIDAAANPILEDQDEDEEQPAAPTVLKVKLFNKKN